jgi:hypoxanthine phosphoribosyltransferase
MSEKLYFTYDEIHQLIDDNADKIKDKGFDYILAIGGGGFMPARLVRRIVKVPIIAVSIKFYDEDMIKLPEESRDVLASGPIHPNLEPVVVQWDKDAIAQLVGKKVLIVDEIYDTGNTLEYVVRRLNSEGVTDLGALVLHHKEKESLPFLRTVVLFGHLNHYYPLQIVKDQWIVYPWEAEDIQEHNKLALLKVYNY